MSRGNRKTPGKWRKNAHLWARDPDDWYVEPDWCNDALFAVERFEGLIYDPACGLGRVLDAAQRAGYRTTGSDIRDRGANHRFEMADFLDIDVLAANIVTNPPYLHADSFAAACVSRVERKCALLLRMQWANSGARSRWLSSLPLKAVYALTPRPSMPPGAVILAGEQAGGGQQDYAWFVFERGYTGKPTFGWARRTKPKQAELFAAEAA